MLKVSGSTIKDGNPSKTGKETIGMVPEEEQSQQFWPDHGTLAVMPHSQAVMHLDWLNSNGE